MATKTYIYQDVAAWLKSNIGGRFPVGQYLPRGGILLQMYNQERDHPTNRITFMQGLCILREEGIVQSRQGKGTLVLSRPSLPEKETTEEDTILNKPEPLVSAITTHREPRIPAQYALKLDQPSQATTHREFRPGHSFGTSDRMEMIDLGSRVQLEFVAANRFDVPNRTIVLTKFPAALVNAMTAVLNAKSNTVVDFAGANFTGRVCAHEFATEDGLRYAFVAEFFTQPKPIGYLIHLEQDELVGLRDRFRQLPVSPHPTD